MKKLIGAILGVRSSPMKGKIPDTIYFKTKDGWLRYVRVDTAAPPKDPT
jgi:hypothetical protein